MDRKDALKLLRESRDQIDRIDDEIINLIQKRTALARDIGKAKIALGMEIEDREREVYIQKKIKKIAKKKKIDENSLKKIMSILTDLNKKEQEVILGRETNG